MGLGLRLGLEEREAACVPRRWQGKPCEPRLCVKRRE